jgi:hypothetical protein
MRSMVGSARSAALGLCPPSTAFGGPLPPAGEDSKRRKRTALNVDWPQTEYPINYLK